MEISHKQLTPFNHHGGQTGYGFLICDNMLRKNFLDYALALLYHMIWQDEGKFLCASVTKIGNSTGVILPKAVAERLKIKQCDIVYLTETPDGYNLTPYDPEFAEQKEAARHGMSDYWNALHKLGKWAVSGCCIEWFLSIHEEQIAKHGGSSGMRDEAII